MPRSKQPLTFLQIAQREEILRRLALGETLTAICRSDVDLPATSTVILWALEDTEPDASGTSFAERYAQARRIGYMAMADELVDASRHARTGRKRKLKRNTTVDANALADDAEGAIAMVQNVDEEVDEYDAVDRARLHVDTLKWLMAKALPKIYGEKLALTGGEDADGQPIPINVNFKGPKA